MRRTNAILAVAITSVFAVVAPASANSISSVENARAKERAGYYLNDEDVGNLRRYGAQSERGGRYGYGDDYDDDGYGPDYGPGVGVYIGTGDPYYDDDY